MSQPIIALRGLTRQFQTGAETVTVLRDVDLDIHQGELVAIIGQSGSGKSTLMNILGCLDRASSGSYAFGGKDIGRLGPDALAELRREHFGFIFQRYQLLPDLDAVENALVLSSGLVTRRDPEGNAMVMVYDPQSEKAEPRRIEVGLNNNIMAEITSGLDEGDEVVSASASARAPTGQQGGGPGGIPGLGGAGGFGGRR